VDIDRPRLLTRCKGSIDAVWLSDKRRALSKQGVQLVFNRIGMEMLGFPINPHCTRHVAASRILQNDPQALETASLALAHKDTKMVSEFYDQSGAGSAQAAWLQLVTAIQLGEGGRMMNRTGRDGSPHAKGFNRSSCGTRSNHWG
jgi:integrase